ncbi:unnamed protein product [Orchesella dallaii]|uniref:Protein cueball n=1 Tax=Orchesella dallaii TaxID=48710 RepID=A0ABP1PPM2_9HEXA
MTVNNGLCMRSVLLFLLLIIPSYCVLDNQYIHHLSDYDLLLLTTSNSLVMLKKNEMVVNELRLPNLPQGNENDAEKHPNAYTSVAPNVQDNLLYFTPGNGFIASLNLSSPSPHILYSTGDSSSISDLAYANNSLYWIEEQVMIKSMKYNRTITLMDESMNGKIQGLSVNPLTNEIYYTLWSKTGRTGEIKCLNNTMNYTLLPNLPLPKSIYSTPHSLIWANNPPGIHFTIESADLESVENRTVIMRQAHHHASSLTKHCGTVYWTDVDGNRLWVGEEQVKKSRIPQSKELPFPGYSFISVQNLGESCKSEQPITVPSTTLAALVSTESSSEVVVSHESVELETPEPVAVTASAPPVRFCSAEQMRDSLCNSGLCLVLNSVPTCLYASTPAPRYLSSVSGNEGAYTWSTSVVAIISVLATVATIMFLFSIYMTVRVRNLTLKPIIRRRVVVSRRTSESSHSNSPTSVCEMIDIENCCNMNVCETPCYERTLLPSSSSNQNTIISVNSSNQNWSNKTDKSCLLK